MTRATPFRDIFKLVCVPNDPKNKNSPGRFFLQYSLPNECGWSFLDAIFSMYMFLRPDLFQRPDLLAEAILQQIVKAELDPREAYLNFSLETETLIHHFAHGLTEIQSFKYTAGIAVHMEMLRQVQTIEKRNDFKESDLLDAVTKLIQKEIDEKIPEKSKQANITDQLECLKL